MGDASILSYPFWVPDFILKIIRVVQSRVIVTPSAQSLSLIVASLALLYPSSPHLSLPLSLSSHNMYTSSTRTATTLMTAATSIEYYNTIGGWWRGVLENPHESILLIRHNVANIQRDSRNALIFSTSIKNLVSNSSTWASGARFSHQSRIQHLLGKGRKAIICLYHVPHGIFFWIFVQFYSLSLLLYICSIIEYLFYESFYFVLFGFLCALLLSRAELYSWADDTILWIATYLLFVCCMRFLLLAQYIFR